MYKKMTTKPLRYHLIHNFFSQNDVDGLKLPVLAAIAIVDAPGRHPCCIAAIICILVHLGSIIFGLFIGSSTPLQLQKNHTKSILAKMNRTPCSKILLIESHLLPLVHGLHTSHTSRRCQ